MTTEYDFAVEEKEKDDKINKAFYDWATTGISVINDTDKRALPQIQPPQSY